MFGRRAPLLIALLALAGCGSGARDRTGAARIRPETLTLANPNALPAEVQPFADAVARLSSGRLRIRFLNAYARGRPVPETGIVRAVQSGNVDLAWVGAREWERLGSHAFQALDAPLLVDSLRLEAAVAAGPIGRRMLAALDVPGVTGIGVIPGPLARILSTRPVRTPADLAGLRVAYQGGPELAAGLRRLGARPVPAVGGAAWAWDAVVQHVFILAENHYDTGGRSLTANLVMWPRPVVLFARTHGLSPVVLGVLRRAAQLAIGAAAAKARDDDRAAMPEFCVGTRRVTVTPAAADAFRARERPEYAELARDRAVGDEIAAIQALRSRLGARTETAPPCPAATARAGIPDGTYESAIVPIGPGGPRGRYRWQIAGGHYVQTEATLGGPSEIGDEGTISAFRGHLVLTAPDGGRTEGRYWFRGGQLITRLYNTVAGGLYVYDRTWRRIK